MRRPESKSFVRRSSVAYLLTKLFDYGRSPKLHSGPSYPAVNPLSERHPHPNNHSQNSGRVEGSRTMETLTIKSPADLLSFIGHTLGFWPQESLVCITVD